MDATSNITEIEYFAAVEDPIKLANGMINKIRLWREYCASVGMLSLWKKKLSNYYGVSIGGNSSHAVTSGGSEGELSLIKVNDLHSLIQGQLVIVTGQRPAGISRAVNSDVQSLKASRIGSAIAEYYMTRPQSGFETKFVSCAETMLLCDEGYLELYWDKTSGEPIAIDPETGKQEMSGDAALRIHSPWNVSRDPGANWDTQKWVILSFKVNKFDYAATYPRFNDQILATTKGDLPDIPMNYIPDQSDSTYAHLLIHDRTPAIPNGRYSLMISDQIILDTELPFADFPVEKMTSSNVIDGPTGYSSANDILALEETSDALHSVIVTNQVTFGGQCLIGPEGGNVKWSDFGKGVRYFEVAPDLVDKLKPLDMLHTPPEIFNYITVLDRKKDQAVGSNSVIKGQPEGQLAGASGAAFALIQAQAISYNSGNQRSYFSCLSAVMTKLVRILAKYADTERTAHIVGKSKASNLKAFKYTGKELSGISSIVYEMTNPLSQTIGGKLQFAQDLLSKDMIKSPKQYINVATTGQLDVLTEDDEADGLLILEENERLTEGRPVKAIVTQIHKDHIKSHTSQITLDMIETDPETVNRILDHVQDHINIWTEASQMNPGILIATNQDPLLPPPPPGLPAPGPGPGGEVSGAPQPPDAPSPNEPSLPNLPNVAGTDEKPVIPGVTN